MCKKYLYDTSLARFSQSRENLTKTCTSDVKHCVFQIQTALNVSIYASPLILTWLYRRDFFSQDGLIYLGKCVAGIGLLYFSAYYIRGIGRVFNPVYRQFIDVLAKASRNPTADNKALLSIYDFYFGAFPTDFIVKNRLVSSP